MNGNRWKKAAGILCLCALLAGLTGCAKKEPLSLTVWTCYNGEQLGAFNEAVEAFNATVGRNKNIVVSASSLGSVNDLEQNVMDAVRGKVGAQEVPDIFSAYADTAYAVDSLGRVADLGPYLTEKDRKEYIESYQSEGDFRGDGSVKIFPVAKATELLVVNDTDWRAFAEATGTSADEFATIEGATAMAQRYYEWTDSLTDAPNDGKALFGRDAMANYMIIGAKQLGCDIFETRDGQTTVNLPREVAKRLWDHYYVPYVKGYFAAYGKFRSDDVKTGDILAYTGSTSSSLYFPDVVESENSSYPIEYIVMNAPVMEGGENCKVQQGAGMAVTKSDAEHEYAACVFLKWFTQKEQNLRFVCNSGYMPVKKDANSISALDELIAEQNLTINDKTYDCLKEVLSDFENTSYYTTKNFENGFAARKVLDYNLSDKAAADREAFEAAVAAGASREEELKKYLSEENFENWYAGFCEALRLATEQ